MDLLSAEEARAIAANAGATALPSEQTLKSSALGKVFSGKKPDGSIWKIWRETEDGFRVEY